MWVFPIGKKTGPGGSPTGAHQKPSSELLLRIACRKTKNTKITLHEQGVETKFAELAGTRHSLMSPGVHGAR